MNNLSITVASIYDENKSHYKYKISYDKTWVVKQKVLEHLFCSHEECFENLLRLLLAIKETNLGIVVDCRTHRRMILYLWVHPYVFQTRFLYVSCLDQLKLDHGLVYALIEWLKRDTNTLHFRHEKMIPTLKDVAALLRLSINGRTITSIGVYN